MMYTEPIEFSNLRKLHKEILNNNTFSEKGGGGLGFLDISRKSGSKLKFDFRPFDENFTYFDFETQIKIENA